MRFIAGGLSKTPGAVTSELTAVNGNPALLVRLDGQIDGIMAFRVEQDRISGIYYVRNPAKLQHIGDRATVGLN